MGTAARRATADGMGIARAGPWLADTHCAILDGAMHRSGSPPCVERPTQHAEFVGELDDSGAPLAEGVGRYGGCVVSICGPQDAERREHQPGDLAAPLKGAGQRLGMLGAKVMAENDRRAFSQGIPIITVRGRALVAIGLRCDAMQ